MFMPIRPQIRRKIEAIFGPDLSEGHFTRLDTKPSKEETAVAQKATDAQGNPKALGRRRPDALNRRLGAARVPPPARPTDPTGYGFRYQYGA